MAIQRTSSPKRNGTTAPKLRGAAKARRHSAHHTMRSLDTDVSVLLGVGFAYFFHLPDEESARDKEDDHPTFIMHFDEA